MIKVKVIGASGYGGIGIIELLLTHPEVKIIRLAAINDIGVPISRIYPHLENFCDLPITDASQQDDEKTDVVFYGDAGWRRHAGRPCRVGGRRQGH